MLEEIDKANSEKKILWEFRSVIEPSCCDVRGNVNDLRKASAICLTLSSKINSHLALIKKFWQNFLIDSNRSGDVFTRSHPCFLVYFPSSFTSRAWFLLFAKTEILSVARSSSLFVLEWKMCFQTIERLMPIVDISRNFLADESSLPRVLDAWGFFQAVNNDSTVLLTNRN